MKPAKAIKAITQQRDKLINKDILSNELWISQTRSYITEIFGEDSEEIKRFKSFRSYPPGLQLIDRNITVRIDKALGELDLFLSDCIESIKIKGVHRKKTGNFLSRLSDTIVTFILTIIGTICFGAGVLVGKIESKPSLRTPLPELKSHKNDKPVIEKNGYKKY